MVVEPEDWSSTGTTEMLMHDPASLNQGNFFYPHQLFVFGVLLAEFISNNGSAKSTL